MLIFHRSNYLDIVQKRKKWEIEVQVCSLEIWRYLPEEIFKSIERTCFLWRRVVFFLSFFKLFFKYSFLPFPTTLSLCLSPPHLPPLIPHHLGFVHLSFIAVSEKLSPFPPIIPSHLPSCHCQPVLNFSVIGYTLLACSFCWLGSC